MKGPRVKVSTRLRKVLDRICLVSSVGVGIGLLACLIGGNYSRHIVLFGVILAWVVWIEWRTSPGGPSQPRI